MRRAALALLIVLAVPASAAAAMAKTTLPAIESQVMCVACKVPLEDAESPEADQERQYIQGLIDEGLSVPKIEQQLVAEYGVGVLALPPDHGFNVVFYILPIALGLAAIALVAVLLPRWRRRTRATPPAAATPTLSPEDTARLEADLAQYER
jgi:cytochrome c-type biogenesis protein CcmH/NrfF